MITTNSVEHSNAALRSLASLLHAVAPEKLDAARLRVTRFDRDALIDSYRRAFVDGRRLTMFIVADELTIRGIPPCFRLGHRSMRPASLEQRFDLFLADLRWLRRQYPDHARILRYRRYRTMLTGSDTSFHREAEFLFYAGQRPAWKIVASLSLNERQQFDCAWLRSAPIKKRDEAIQATREQVFKTLQDALNTVRRTSCFTNADAEATLLRRQQLWLCSRMVRNGSPTEIADRYLQATGQEITRQAVAKQLAKIDEILRKMR